MSGGRKYEFDDNVLVPTVVLSPPSWTLAASIVGKGTNEKLVCVRGKRKSRKEIGEECSYAEEDAEAKDEEGSVEFGHAGRGRGGVVLIPPL